MANLKDTIVLGVLRVFGKIKANVIEGNLTGNADTTTKLKTARKISLTGGATGEVTTDMSADASISVTLNQTNSLKFGDTAVSTPMFEVKYNSTTKSIDFNSL